MEIPMSALFDFYTGKDILDFCEACIHAETGLEDEPCKSCTVTPSNFEEKTDDQD